MFSERIDNVNVNSAKRTVRTRTGSLERLRKATPYWFVRKTSEIHVTSCYIGKEIAENVLFLYYVFDDNLVLIVTSYSARVI